MSAAPHDALLFSGPVRATIDPHGALHPELITAAVAAAGLDRDVLDAELTEQGRSLSGGQRQRVALARALAAAPPVLVLHEPTTAVDSVTEASVAARLRDLRAGAATLLVTASPALLAACDRVQLVRDGAVVATGTHAALLAEPRYRAVVLA